jgi:hypothetical protein
MRTQSVFFLNIHGLTIGCRADSEELLAELVRPFQYFKVEETTPSFMVSVNEDSPAYEELPALPAFFSTPRNVVYRDGNRKIIDYFGKGIVFQNGEYAFEIRGLERNFLSEAFYLLVLSLLGQFCDANGFLRIHALAFSHQNRAVIVLLPQGGGKSRLALELMGEPDVRYISDDDPILNPSGQILPFPRPLGILSRDLLHGIPDEYVYCVDRMEFGLKYYVDSNFWPDKIETRALNEIVLLVARKVLNGTPAIHTLSKWKALRVLMRDAVVGIGLYQGLEFLFSHSSWEAMSKFPVLVKRLMRAVRLTRSANTYELILGSDIRSNARTLIEFLRKNDAKNGVRML